MTHEQLVQVVLDAYDARKDTREYFEFFLNPDVGRQMEKATETVRKELGRVKWGKSKARVTVFKTLIKNFIGLNPGPEHVLEMMTMVLTHMAVFEKFVNYTSTQEKYAATLMNEILAWGDRHQLADTAIANINALIQRDDVRLYFRQYLAQNMQTEK